MAYWPPHIINGRELDLLHLEPFILRCPVPVGPGNPLHLQINVRFSCHCFSEAFDPARHDPGVIVMDHKTPRAFDLRRYELSRFLPGLVGAFPERKVHQTYERRNYCYFQALAECDGQIYEVFFNIRRAAAGESHHLNLFVESAYPSEVLHAAKRPNAIRFSILALKVFKNEPVRFAVR